LQKAQELEVNICHLLSWRRHCGKTTTVVLEVDE
jgi:hypothetical protein